MATRTQRAAAQRNVKKAQARRLEIPGADDFAISDRYDKGGTTHVAFVLDPDGHNVEAVWHAPES